MMSNVATGVCVNCRPLVIYLPNCMRANELESERMNAVFLCHFFLMSFLLYLTLFFSLCSFSHSPRVSRSNSAVGSNRANVYTLTNRRTLIFVD